MVGAAVSMAALIWLLKFSPRLSVKEALSMAFFSIIAGLAIEYATLPFDAIANVRPISPMDLLTLKSLTVASALIEIGYSLLMFAAIRYAQALWRGEEAAQPRSPAEDGVVPSESSAAPMARMASRAFAPIASFRGEAVPRSSAGEAVAIAAIRIGLLFGFFAALIPGAVASYLLSRRMGGAWIAGLAIAWLASFAALATYLHCRRVMHIGSSVFAALAVVGVAAYIGSSFG